MRSGVVRCMARHGNTAIALPKTRKQQSDIAVAQLEDLRRQLFRASTTPPDTHCAQPDDDTYRIIAVDAADAYGKAAFVTLNNRSGVWETLDGLHELIAMPRLRRVEIKRAGMTKIAFGDQIGEDENPVA